MTKPPRLLRLAGIDVPVRFVPAENIGGNCGWFDPAAEEICISNSMTPRNSLDTLLHETFHAILYSQGREYGGKTEELYVRALATGLTGALRDNPEFATWLLTYRHKT